VAAPQAGAQFSWPIRWPEIPTFRRNSLRSAAAYHFNPICSMRSLRLTEISSALNAGFRIMYTPSWAAYWLRRSAAKPLDVLRRAMAEQALAHGSRWKRGPEFRFPTAFCPR
jgi:hypothetical protein